MMVRGISVGLCALLFLLVGTGPFASVAEGARRPRKEGRSRVVERPIVVAHRGASGYLPEHTLVAKAMAHAFDPDYIEQDVALTKDDVPVVLHDHYLDTVTDVAERHPRRARKDGRFYVIDFTLAEIRGLRVFERIDLKTGKPAYPKRFPPLDALPFRVSTLEEEIRFLQGLNRSRGKNVGIYVELKAPAFHRAEGKDIAAIVLPLLARLGYRGPEDRCFVQCFDPGCLKTMRHGMKTRLKLIQLVADDSWNETPGVCFSDMLTSKGMAKVARYAEGLGPWIPQLVTKDGRPNGVVARAHALGLAVHPYTLRVDELPDWAPTARKLMDLLFRRLRVDGVFSDFPDVVVDYLRRTGKRAP